MKCENCCFFRYEDDDPVPRCHFYGFGLAPCEEDDDDYECDDED